MTERVESNLTQQIRNTKSQTNARLATTTHICYLTWQGWQLEDRTFTEPADKNLIQRIWMIRQLLDKGEDND